MQVRQTANKDQRTIRIILYLALLTTLVFPTAEYLLIKRYVTAQENLAGYINDSGRQRMLSQRIALLSEHFIEAETAAERALIKERLETALEHMSNANERLTATVNTFGKNNVIEQEISEHYLARGTGVTDAVKSYIQHARQLTNSDPALLSKSNADFMAISSAAMHGLLEKLEQATRLHQNIAKARISELKHNSLLVFITAISALILLTIFVFRPLLRRMFRSIGQVHLLQTVAVATNKTASIEEGLQAAIDSICDFTGWPVGHAYIYDADRDLLTSSRVWFYPFEQKYQTFREASDDFTFKPGEGLIGRVYQEGKPSWVADVTRDNSYLRTEQAKAAKLVTAFAFPITIGSQVVAVLEFYAKHQERPDPRFYAAMASIGQMLGQVVERSRAADESQLLKTVITSANDSVIITKASIDEPGPEIIFVNEAFTNISGYSYDEVIGKSPRFLQGPDTDKATLADIRQSLDYGRTYKGEILNYRKDGTPYWLELSIVPVKNSYGCITHFTAVERDITERKEAEARYAATMMQLQAANLRAEAVTRDLEESLHAAEQHNQAKSDFLANMSHELRTPMNGVIGMAQLLAETPLSDEQNEYVKTISGSAEALLTLLNDILDVSKIEAGVLELEQIAFSPRQTVQNVQALLSPLALNKEIDFACEFESDLPDYIWGDSSRFRQIITNLLSNAIKFTQAGHVRLTMRTNETEGGDVIHCRVEDTGIGIPADKLDMIFEKFVQADTTVTRKFGGTGLGLTITREIIAMVGGAMGVESLEGKGSTFWFNLPFKAATENDVLVASALDQMPSLIAIDKQPIADAVALLVEDYPVNQIFAQKILRKLGFARVELAENGIEALQKYHEHPYAIIFMDCQMPQLDGYQTTQEIRNLETKSGRYTPIVAMTANAMVGDREKCLKVGMDEYLSKPLKPERLLAVLNKWFTFDARPETASNSGNVVSGDAQPVFDLAQLRNFTNGDPEEERQLIQLFMEKAEEGIATLRTSLAEHDDDTWRATAHRLKGAAGNFGAMTLQHFFKRAETRAADSDDKKQELLGLIAAEMKKVHNFASNISSV